MGAMPDKKDISLGGEQFLGHVVVGVAVGVAVDVVVDVVDCVYFLLQRHTDVLQEIVSPLLYKSKLGERKR
jgi:hypothetical protein